MPIRISHFEKKLKWLEKEFNLKKVEISDLSTLIFNKQAACYSLATPDGGLCLEGIGSDFTPKVAIQKAFSELAERIILKKLFATLTATTILFASAFHPNQHQSLQNCYYEYLQRLWFFWEN